MSEQKEEAEWTINVDSSSIFVYALRPSIQSRVPKEFHQKWGNRGIDFTTTKSKRCILYPCRHLPKIAKILLQKCFPKDSLQFLYSIGYAKVGTKTFSIMKSTRPNDHYLYLYEFDFQNEKITFCFPAINGWNNLLTKFMKM